MSRESYGHLDGDGGNRREESDHDIFCGRTKASWMV